MQPGGDSKGEIWAAVVVVVVIGVALVAALLLSTAQQPESEPTTSIALGTQTVAPPTRDTTQPVIIVPSRTATATTTATVTATATTTATVTAMVTPSATTRVTSTPTDTPAPTRTQLPTASPTATWTRTPTSSPTATRTRTPTSSPTATRTPTASPTATYTQTTSPTATHTALPTATVPPCGPPVGWVQDYVVQRGDTLYNISRRFGTSVDALRNANCLTSDRILVGQRLWVPNLAPVPEASPPPADTSTPPPDGQPTSPSLPEVNPTTAVAADPCSNPIARITSPRYGEQVSGLFWIEGTADIPNFLRYEIDVRRDGSDTWMHLGSDRTRVVDGQLAQVQTSRFGSGAFWVRLTVVDKTYNYPPRCAVLLYFP